MVDQNNVKKSQIVEGLMNDKFSIAREELM